MCICIWMARVGYLNAKTLSAEVPFNTHGAMTKPRGRRTQASASLRLQITLWVIGTHLSPHQHTCAHLRMSEIPRRRWPCASSVALKAPEGSLFALGFGRGAVGRCRVNLTHESVDLRFGELLEALLNDGILIVAQLLGVCSDKIAIMAAGQHNGAEQDRARAERGRGSALTRRLCFGSEKKIGSNNKAAVQVMSLLATRKT